MFYVGYKLSSFGNEEEQEFETEQEAMAEAVRLLKQGYIVQVNEE